MPSHISHARRRRSEADRPRIEADLSQLLEMSDWTKRPDATGRLLGATRLGIPDAIKRLHVLAFLLKRDGRIDDLLRLHRMPFRFPDSPSKDLPAAVNQLEWQVVTLPRLSRLAAELAAQRLEWAVGHADPAWRSAIEHTLAVARIRQGRYAEAESLCKTALIAERSASNRATVLATLAIARHMLGQDGQQPLAEALTLDPAAELVSEAEQVLSRPPRTKQSALAWVPKAR